MELPSIALRMFMKAARWSQLGEAQKHSEFPIQISQTPKVIQCSSQSEKQDFQVPTLENNHKTLIISSLFITSR